MFTDEERIRILKLVDKKPDIRNLAIHLCFQTGVRVKFRIQERADAIIGEQDKKLFCLGWR